MVKGHPDFTKAIDIVLQTLDDININIDAQTVGVKIEAEWQIYKGNQKTLFGKAINLAVDTASTVINYMVPTGKMLFVFNIVCSSFPSSGVPLQTGRFDLYAAGVNFAAKVTTPESPSVVLAFNAPLRLDAGEYMTVAVWNFGTAAGHFATTVHGFEVAA